jgi:hypothetical protein
MGGKDTDVLTDFITAPLQKHLNGQYNVFLGPSAVVLLSAAVPAFRYMASRWSAMPLQSGSLWRFVHITTIAFAQ